MSSEHKSVFLSYASQDAGAALRIAEALRNAGIEVWFDQNELVGGDAWDAKIRRQIKDCALFVPIISANTQARREGYFRLEWKLAAQRTHTMADGTPFLLPVVIDASRDNVALVPEEFRAVQWMRLANDAAMSVFCARVQTLLREERPPRGEAAVEVPKQRVARARRPQRPWTVALVSIFALSGLALLWWQYGRSAEARRSETFGATTAERSQRRAEQDPPDRSLAVLPFENRSDNADNAYFTNGVHEDVLTNLASISALRVVSRTSVMAYLNTKKTTPEIGRELSVRYVLEGSVQRSRDIVRVACRLIDAQTDKQVWGNRYEKDVTNIFALQTELSAVIARELRAVLSPEEQRRLERTPTINAAAYDLYLQARAQSKTLLSIALLNRQAELLQRAVELDAEFAEAWADLAYVHARYIGRGFDTSEQRLERADAAIARAFRLAPDSPEVIRRMGDYAAEALNDHARAQALYLRLAKMQPNDPTVHVALARSAWKQHQWREAITSARRATELDPANSTASVTLSRYLASVRRWDETIAEQTRRLKLRSDKLNAEFELACSHFLARGDTDPGKRFFAALSAEQANTPAMILNRKHWDFQTGDLSHYLELDRVMPYHPDYVAADNPEKFVQAILGAIAYATVGDRSRALARLGELRAEARAQLERENRNPQVWTSLAIAEAVVGDRTEAMRAGHRAVELEVSELPWAVNLAIVKAWAGDRDGAVADLARLLLQPAQTLLVQGPLNVHHLRASPIVAPLKGDPRFEALLNDPRNNAPLF